MIMLFRHNIKGVSIIYIKTQSSNEFFQGDNLPLSTLRWMTLLKSGWKNKDVWYENLMQQHFNVPRIVYIFRITFKNLKKMDM